ncbi:LANO_0G05688g1_1 [Lachancea nothofagi CBS 11611]|uniref:LANO_0G05688g1_1 n=1 Tax=Lachancea nothofagi CBS 11611 TaxID=1266666 RepID=A0A1G4KGQ5_9SACH|nr:LANO_0G05688g1_1 [Lachancea nothofagi CBS 11611]
MSKKGSVKKSIKQVDASLHEPINRDVPPTIYGTNLKPELASAALNLSVDFLKQQQALANHFLVCHPKTIAFVLLGSFIYLVPNVNLPRNTRSVISFAIQFVLMNRVQLLTCGVVVAIVASVLFTLLSKFTDSFFKEKINQVIDSDGSVLFDCKLTELAGGIVKDKKKLQNTQIILYRETPIALVSVLANSGVSDNDSLVMGVSTIGCRRVYAKSGIVEDLLDWAVIRTKNIQSEGSNDTSNSMKLLVEVYSFDNNVKDVLKKKGYSLVKSCNLSESKLLGGLFGVQKELWGVQFHYDAKKQK